MDWLHNVGLPFFTAVGVVVGGCVIGSLAGVVFMNSPFHTMLVIAKPLKFWAILAAIGGTFSTIEAIETSVWTGELRLLLQQLTMIVCSFLGASVGYWIVLTLAGGE